MIKLSKNFTNLLKDSGALDLNSELFHGRLGKIPWGRHLPAGSDLPNGLQTRFTYLFEYVSDMDNNSLVSASSLVLGPVEIIGICDDTILMLLTKNDLCFSLNLVAGELEYAGRILESAVLRLACGFELYPVCPENSLPSPLRSTIEGRAAALISEEGVISVPPFSDLFS